MKFKPLPSVARIEELLSYDPETGIFRWKKYRNARATVGQVAGRFNRGYRLIMIDYQQYHASRLAFKVVNAKDPAEEIDHINGKPFDNRIKNLRESTHAQNCQNARLRRDNKTKLKGVCRNSSRGKPWLAFIQVNGKQKQIGLFESAEQAHVAYCEAAHSLHGEFARTE